MLLTGSCGLCFGRMIKTLTQSSSEAVTFSLAANLKKNTQRQLFTISYTVTDLCYIYLFLLFFI
jgi:hypothetical protein